MDLSEIRKQITTGFLNNFENEKKPEDGYTDFAYPKFFKLMKFNTERYAVKGFGHFMTMHTRTKMGMTLLTASFTPGEGAEVPYLLIDIMTLGKKRTVFVEYYDCTGKKCDAPLLNEIHDRYNDLQEYAEKPKWYVGERTGYSLIKCGTAEDDEKLVSMINESVKAYAETVRKGSTSKENLSGLLKFRDRMIEEGNPSSAVLTKVFGNEGAADFFKKCVMPVED